MKARAPTLLFLFSAFLSFAQPYYFPPSNDSEWETLPPEELGWCAEKVDSLIGFLEEKNTKSFILLKDGRIVLEEYFGTFTPDSLWYWASAGKSLMGVMIGLAQEDGYLNIEDPTSDYLGEGWTECAPEKEALIKVRHQISMSTGLDDRVEPVGSTSNCFEPSCFQYLADAGTRWAYHNSVYRIVQDVLETATGQEKSLYTRQRLGNRIGMKGFWFNYVYYSTARDMARFGLFNLSRGVWNGDTVLADTAYIEAMANTSQPMNPSYGYLWWLNGKSSYLLPGLQFSFSGSLIPEAPADLFAALGKNDQKIYIVPGEGLVVVRQGESAGGVSPAASSFDNQLWLRLMNLSCATSVDEWTAAEQGLRLSPNPAREQVVVKASARIKELRLFDLNGRLLRTLPGNDTFRQAFSLEGLVSGLYWLQAITGEEQLSVKLVVR